MYAFSPEDQADLFQEISIQLWRSVPNHRGESAENVGVKISRIKRRFATLATETAET